jgi:ribosomal protein RSM22 (predicted rRNA methylase)
VAPVDNNSHLFYIFTLTFWSQCPHDGFCPLRLTSDVCAFPQRFTRPVFLRKTKHAKKDFEDVTYSYVVIRRGERPLKPASSTRLPVDESEASEPDETAPTAYPDHVDSEPGEPVPKVPQPEYSMGTERQLVESISREREADQEELERLRLESYHWRRIIYSPMKGSGHITMDTCTPKGECIGRPPQGTTFS